MGSTRESAARLGAEIAELCSYIYAAEHRLLTLVREFDEQEGWRQAGFLSCAHWLNFNCGIDMNTARERVRVAHALGHLPKIDARFASGALSYSKVRAMTRIADETNEDYLLSIAKHGTAHHVEKLVSKFRRVKRLRDVEAANTAHDNRQLHCHYDSEGCLVIKGRFPAEQGALVIKALEMAAEKRFADEENEPEPIAARRADALAEVAEIYMNSEPVPNATGDRYQVVVHVSAETSAECPHIEDGPHVSAETSRRIGCDCSLLAIREDEDGQPLSIGRKTRSIPPAMRRALRIRDGGCKFPGCTHDKFVDGHHIRHWADGGATNLDNLVLLCRRHHHLVHEGGFTCEKTNGGEILFQDEQRARLPEWTAMPTIGEHDVNEWLDRNFFENGVEPGACNAQWYAGDRMDWNLAVGNLFS